MLPVGVLLVFLAVIVGVPGYCGLLETFLLLELEDDGVLGVLGVAGLDGVFWSGWATLLLTVCPSILYGKTRQKGLIFSYPAALVVFTTS